MRVKIAILGLAALFGATSTGCNEDAWYDTWYDETPEVASPDATYNSSYLTFDTAYLEAAYLGCADDVHYWYSYSEFSGAANAADAFVSFDGNVVPASYVEFHGGFADDGTSSCVCEVYSEGASQGGLCDGDYTGDDAKLNECGAKLPFFEYLYTEHELAASCELEILSDFSFTQIVTDFSDGSTTSVTFGEGVQLNYAL